MISRVVVFLALFILIFGAVSVMAQDGATDEPPTAIAATLAPTPMPTVDPGAGNGGPISIFPDVQPGGLFDELLKSAFAAFLAAFGASPVTMAIVAVLKRIPGLDKVDGPVLVLAVSAVLYIGAGAARWFGQEELFGKFLLWLTDILPLLTGVIVTLIGAPFWHKQAVKGNVPLLGYERTPETPVTTPGVTDPAATGDIASIPGNQTAARTTARDYPPGGYNQ